MPDKNKIQGFSKLSREEKIRIASEFAAHPVEFANQMFSNLVSGTKTNDPDHEFTENAISEFRLPYSVAPNFLIDGKVYIVPMVTEESSVVAAASMAAKFWHDRGGFHTTVSGISKPGHIHFLWKDSTEKLNDFFNGITGGLRHSVSEITKSMQARGGGIKSIRLVDYNDKIPGYFQIEVLFNTVDAMGANFINSCLESMSEYMISQAKLKGVYGNLEIIMSILSNYTPECLVKCEVLCNISDLKSENDSLSADELARRFSLALQIAGKEISRAVTHNKGIFNGIDAVLIATGNDFRAAEAAGHAWACRNGSYSSLSELEISNDRFHFSISLPLPVGVTGGITNLHPMTKASLQLLGNPNAPVLMSVIAAAGMANHFSAIKALVTQGIQKGHMKLHLINILNQLNADANERESAIRHFSQKKVSYNGVKEFIFHMRST